MHAPPRCLMQSFSAESQGETEADVILASECAVSVCAAPAAYRGERPASFQAELSQRNAGPVVGQARWLEVQFDICMMA